MESSKELPIDVSEVSTDHTPEEISEKELLSWDETKKAVVNAKVFKSYVVYLTATLLREKQWVSAEEVQAHIASQYPKLIDKKKMASGNGVVLSNHA